MEVIDGSCHCGKVTWQAEMPPKLVLNCHCNMCRKLGGADYSSWVIFPDTQFHLTSGNDDIADYQARPKFSKSFCKSCGSIVKCVNNAKFPRHTYVARGNINSDTDFIINSQVYTVDKAPWVSIDPNIKIFNP